ncbi:GNAT family N-acetyltransferase [Paracoccaceae bacterium Fryx2]|nr:GNAT family N-acetyltransferase [Paracoccaceae bacterium Fryx2]
MDGITLVRLDETTAALLADTDVFDHPVRPDQLAAFMADPLHEMVLAVDAGAVVGMASGAVLLHPDKLPGLFINEVGVNDTHRRRGIGTALVARRKCFARARGCAGIRVATKGDNVAARALCRRAGARRAAS